MADITQIDEINENDLVAALSDIPSIPMETKPTLSSPSSNDDKTVTNETLSTNLDLSTITELLQQAINGKTVEITIKIKD